MRTSTRCFSQRPIALAAALLCLTLMPAWAGIGVTGASNTGPTATPIGPGSTTASSTGLWVGNGGIGSLLVDAGSFLQLARLSLGSGTGSGSGLITGIGTKVELVGDGASNSQVTRLLVGDWGTGSLTVNGGAILDARVNQSPCLLAQHYCDSFVGGAAGDTAVLNIDGANTAVRIGQTLRIAHAGLAVQSLNGYTYGVPGGTTRGTVNLTGGALLSTNRAIVGNNQWDAAATGYERNFAEVNVSGAGSRWVVSGGNIVNHSNGVVGEGGAFLGTSDHRNASAVLNVTGGGTIEIQGPQGSLDGGGMNMTTNGGRTDMQVSGANSRLLFTGDNTFLQIGRRIGSALLSVLGGGTVTGVQYVSIGRDGAFGELVLDGAGSLLSATGVVSPAAHVGNGSATLPYVAGIDIGRNGNGTVVVRNGARLEVKADVRGDGGPTISLGRDASSSGRLSITGPGSTVYISAKSVLPGGGPGEAYNPFMRVGRDGSGELTITQGGKLLMDGQAIATVADERYTSLFIGGTSATTPGGKGVATVSGAGSEIKLTGSDTNVTVGYGPKATGHLDISDQGKVSAIGLGVGSAGGTGVLRMDNGTVALAGQQTGGNLAGAYLVLGNGGIGIASMANGSVIHVSNSGAGGAGVILGGTAIRPGGDGSLSMASGSQITIQAAPGLGELRIGRDGSGLVRMRGASSINVTDGLVLIARDKGSDGTLLMSENSSVTAGWVGVGRNKTTTGDVDGGTGTMVLINSTLTAPTIVIGTNGFLGGSGTINGNVINHGIFSPGNSPGTLEINGSFTALASSKMILEVESDGHGGFLTDHVIFKGGQPLDLSQLNAEFRFLGATDPNAFGRSKMFNINTFFQSRQPDNSLTALAPTVFKGAVFSAQAESYQITSFSFDAATGGTITAAVPEPESWALMLAGLLTISALARRRVQPRQS